MLLVITIWFFWLPMLMIHSTGSSTSNARALDALLQVYAYQAFVRPKTGPAYDGVVPSNLTGIKTLAMRLRSGSLRTRGVKMYKEFKIPRGVVEQPYVERLALVYQNLGNWSMVYYPLPGYIYLAPVLGLLVYDASNLSAKNLPQLDIRASGQPISIEFSDLKLVPYGSSAECVSFNLNGSVDFSNVVSNNLCSTFQQGHFSIVVKSTAPSTPPGSAPVKGSTRSDGTRKKNTVWAFIGSLLGGLALLILFGFLVLWLQNYKHGKKMQQMEKVAEVGEALHMTTIGNTRAPAASVTRTQPTLEDEYVP